MLSYSVYVVQNLAKRDEFLQRLLDQQSDDESVQSAADSEFENDSADDPESERLRSDASVYRMRSSTAFHFRKESIDIAYHWHDLHRMWARTMK